MLQPESKIDVDTTVGIKPDLRPGQAFPPGRGVYVANRRWQLVQVGRHPAAGAGTVAGTGGAAEGEAAAG